ncbi:MAG: type II secretion system protein GspG [Bdellovibrionaceae bacterium]|nr:type II secretion system protein GspG [Pseudobdellovibrionaceae bacterium]
MMLNQKGMTLLEMMIVLVILAGLVAALSTNVLDTWEKAKHKQATIQVKELKRLLAMYLTDCGNYPSEEGPGSTFESSDECSSWGPRPYINSGQLKDPLGRPVVYELQDGIGVIIIWGRDGKEGGSDPQSRYSPAG